LKREGGNQRINKERKKKKQGGETIKKPTTQMEKGRSCRNKSSRETSKKGNEGKGKEARRRPRKKK